MDAGKHYFVGDKGQRFEIRYQLRSAPCKGDPTYPCGWATNIEAAQAMARGVEKHPSFCNPVIIDRNLKEAKK